MATPLGTTCLPLTMDTATLEVATAPAEGHTTRDPHTAPQSLRLASTIGLDLSSNRVDMVPLTLLRVATAHTLPRDPLLTVDAHRLLLPLRATTALPEGRIHTVLAHLSPSTQQDSSLMVPLKVTEAGLLLTKEVTRDRLLRTRVATRTPVMVPLATLTLRSSRGGDFSLVKAL